MAKDKVKITGDWSAWAEPVHQGRLVRPDGEAAWVLIRCRPDEQVDDEGFAALKTKGRLMARIDHPSVLKLLHITRVDGVPAWVYEGFQGVSVARALDVASTQREFLPARAVMDMAERTVQGIQAGIQQGRDLQGPGSGVVHVGPAPSEVLVDAVGAIRLAGFRVVGEGEQPPSSPTGYAPARPGTAEQRAAYGVGAMLVHLLGGERPASAGVERARQDAVIRRSMIRVLARPGEAIPESVTALIQRALSFDPDERPELDEIQDTLSLASAGLKSAGLRSWAPLTIPVLLNMGEHGYPDPDTARMKRHIEPTDDSSFLSSPGRKRKAEKKAPPREVKTTVGRPAVNPRDLQPYEADPAEATPFIGSQSLDSMPTSETDVASLQIRRMSGEATEPEIPVEVGGVEDTWEVETAEEPERVGGWPLVAGLIIGMIVAVGVGQVAVDTMVSSTAPAVEQPTSPQPVPAAPSTEQAEVVLAAAADTGEDEEPDSVPESASSGDSGEADAEDAPSAPAASEPPRTRKKAAEPQSAPDEAEPDVFQVTFRSADTTMDRMVVRCHKGGTGEGAEFVTIVRAGKGPCRVEGHWGESKKTVMPVITGPRDYTCFKDGARRCD